MLTRFIAVAATAAIILVITPLTCTVPDAKVERTLAPLGFTDVEPRGFAWFACSKGDAFASEFEATSPTGERVEGTVCCGVLKDCTVRW